MLNDYGYSRKNGKNQSERKSHSITPYPLLTSLQGIQQSYRGRGGGEITGLATNRRRYSAI